jgi:malonate-semialdehyde dehydrogenase (acetylating)/methylmalonate-semialdehyde dehydrogenase
VVAGITPFNFPVHGADVDVPGGHRLRQHLRAQAQRARPSPSLFIAELLKQAGLPDGVFNVVQGDKVAVDALLEHPDVKA